MSALTKRGLMAVLAAVLIALGVAAPAIAGSRQSSMKNWQDGDASSNWNVAKLRKTHVTFDSCTREFNAKIRRTISLRPDPKVGEEWINCRSYADAVYAGAFKESATYHFDISGMGIYNCIGGSCVMNKTTVPVLHIYW